MVDASQLGHVRIGPAVERLDPMELHVIADLCPLEQHVTSEAGYYGDHATTTMSLRSTAVRTGLGPNDR